MSAQPFPARRVVITGLGVIAPNGIGKEAFWQSCVRGQSGLKPITRFDARALPARIAGEVTDFDAHELGLTEEEARLGDRATQFALGAANLALRDAGSEDILSDDERTHMGVYVGMAIACLEEGEQVWASVHGYSDRQIAPSSTLLMSHAAASSIAAHHRLHGPSAVIATGCSAGADAIGEAFWLIQEGYAERMLAGGTDAAISYGVLDAFSVMGALSTRYNDEPWRASRPYDQRRDGFVMAEGAGILLLEEHELALARGAHIYAEILAFCSNSNAYHMTSLPSGGEPLQGLLRQALDEAEVTPAQLGYINAHGSSTQPNEVAETTAYKAVFNEHAPRIPISATKSLIGHTQGAASAIEAIVTALALERQIIPPTINQEEPDPRCNLDYVPNVARPATIDIALTHSSGFGGVNSVLILARPDWT
ncbi:MAG: beta-ketoacyl-[acyl-carrier-protein] synthase family protein [Ktedonobacteraceae bacterium]|nr:beta-ketoacyl-[acyl-carrier-protein] synthase family protein [Ktedonobacteraceae bacterium]